jgi:hypothetical protein
VLGSALLAGFAFSPGYAQDQEQKPAEQAVPSNPDIANPQQKSVEGPAPSSHGMMGGQDMTGQMQRMMGSPGMTAQMRQMMENCNKMMEIMMQQSPTAPAPKKKG